MPFYEYECSVCHHHLEALQKIADAPLKKCPECGKPALLRLISAPVFRLKGGGWYETDFKSEGETKRNLAKDEAPESKSEEKSDAKAAAKPATTSTESPAARAAPKKPAAKPVASSKSKPSKAAKPAKKKARR